MPLPWNSKEVQSRVSNVKSSHEIKSFPNKVPQQVQHAKENIEKEQSEIIIAKNNILDMSNSSNISSQATSTSIIHSAEQSFGKYNIKM